MTIAGVVARLLVLVLVEQLLAFSEDLLPSRTPGERAYRRELVEAIVVATDDAQEQRQLVKLARFESTFREDVGRCKRLGPEGEVGPFQELPRSKADRENVCRSLEGAARVAVERVRESVRVCHFLPPEERLAVYARGRCSSRDGRRMSRARYTP